MPFTIFLLTGFMKSVPRELDEAALIEGSSYFRLFTQIIVPLLITPLITSSIVITTNVWNDFFAPFYLISSTKKQPIVISIHRFVSMYGTDWGVVFAFMVMVIAPVLLIYAFLQRYIIDGLTSGSLKG
jgi:raffinose/stachyose/melibiose transport system permease protein